MCVYIYVHMYLFNGLSLRQAGGEVDEERAKDSDSGQGAHGHTNSCQLASQTSFWIEIGNAERANLKETPMLEHGGWNHEATIITTSTNNQQPNRREDAWRNAVQNAFNTNGCK